MKKVFSLFLLILIAVSLSAQSVGMSPFGYGAAATGGGNNTPTLVSSVSALKSALESSGSKVIIVTQNLTFTSCMKVSSSNKTLLGLPGVTLTSLQQNKDNSGILMFSSCSNIIIRNLTFVGPGAYDCDGYDLLCFDGVTKAWVDHCDFQDGCDGNFDNKGKTDNVTVSWCRFRYLKSPKAGGPGGADDHRFTNLLGSSSSDKPSDGTYNMTWAYCWWDNGCRERMLRCRNASLHFLNCYWNSSVANYYIGPENADCYIEGCSFQGAPRKEKIFYQNYGGTNGATFVGCIAAKGVPGNVTNRSVVTPSYSYTALSATDAVSAVTDATCGAGATLLVTLAGVISLACDVDSAGGSTPGGSDQPSTPDTPISLTDTVTQSVWWNFSDSDFDLGTLSAPVAVRKLHIAASAQETIVFDGNNKSLDGFSFTRRLKFGGAGSIARNVSFVVSGSCSLEVYLISSSSSADRDLSVATESFSNVVSTMRAIGTSISKATFTYTGGPTTIYLYPASAGINLYGIRVTVGNDSNPPLDSAVADKHASASVVEKVFIDGHLYIITPSGEQFDMMGRRVY